jgi:hypothetical protein
MALRVPWIYPGPMNIRVRALVDQAIWGWSLRIGQSVPPDEFRALEQFLNFVQFLTNEPLLQFLA